MEDIDNKHRIKNKVSNSDVNLMIDIICGYVTATAEEREELEERLREINLGNDPY